MRYKSKTKQSLALLGALMMVLSVAAMGFAGTAAADVQDIGPNGVEAGDLVAGTDSVNQTVTFDSLENDGNSETITITTEDPTDDSDLVTSTGEITAARLADEGSHDVDTVSYDGTGDTITVELNDSTGVESDLAIEVEWDLTQISNTDVQYNAAFGGSDLGDVDTEFSISEAQPSFGNQDTTVEDAGGPTGSLITVDFGDDVALADGADNSDLAGAFTVSGAEDADGNELFVDSADIDAASDSELELELDGYINSSISTGDLTVDYQGATDNGGETTSSDDVVVLQSDADVPALSTSIDENVQGNTLPTLESAEVTDSNGDDRPELTVTFSEEIDAQESSFNSNGVFTFGAGTYSSNQTVIENAGDGEQNQVIVGVDPEVQPADNFDDLSYDDAEATGNLVSTSSGDTVAVSSGAVSNTIAPNITSAAVSAAGDELVVTFDDGDANVALEEGNDNPTDGFTLSGTDASITDDVSIDNENAEVTITLSEAVEAGDGDLTLEYASGSDAIQSLAGVNTEAITTAPSNNVVPTLDSAEVTDQNPDQLVVTFTEDVQTDVGSGNIDSAVTDAFTLQDGGGDTYRIRNLSSHTGDTIVLNLGAEDGTPEPVPSTADLSGALTYTNDAPTGDEAQPFIAASGTEEPVETFEDQDVANNVGITAQLTERGQYLEVTFTEDITRAGTPSEVVSEFDTSGKAIVLEDDAFEEIKDGDTVVFNNGNDHTSAGSVVAAPDNVDSSTGVTIDYTPSGALLNSQEEQPSQFTDESVTNNIQPFITDVSETESNIQLIYSENVDAPADDDAFTLSGTDAELNGVNDDDNTDQFSLTLDPGFSDTDSGITLSYADADGASVGASGSSAVALDETVDVTNPLSPAPQLMNATVDDVDTNNADNGDGEIVLTFDRDVQYTSNEANLPEGAVDGLSFESNTRNVSIEFQEGDRIVEVYENHVAVEFTSTTGSASSAVNAGDDLSNAVLTIENAANVDIESTAGAAVQGDDSTEEVSNEIAGELATVESTEINTELIGTDVDPDGDEIEITVTGFNDSSGTKVIDTDDSVDVEIGGESFDVSPNRFSDSVTIEPDAPGSFDRSDVEVGSEVTVDVAGAEVTSTENVTYVHEAFTASEGYQFESQPMPGEFVATENITDIAYYDADAGADEEAFATYGSESEVQDVHNALFVNADTADAEYGFAYDEDRSGLQTNIGSIEMNEGWHIVGSNYDIGLNSQIGLSEDLATQNNPGSTEQLDAQLKTLPGTTLPDDAGVENHAVYYVFVYEGEERAIVLPEYTGTDSTGSSVNADAGLTVR